MIKLEVIKRKLIFGACTRRTPNSGRQAPLRQEESPGKRGQESKDGKVCECCHWGTAGFGGLRLRLESEGQL